MNNCSFIGRFVRDPEIRTTSQGKKVVNFSLAISRKFKKNGSKELQEEVSFPDFEAWDSGAELIHKHFVKGDSIAVESSLKTDTWESEEGKKRSKLKFRVNRFFFLGSRKGGGAEAVEEAVAVGDNDNIPF
jgi:single-strand DNA-binding protein